MESIYQWEEAFSWRLCFIYTVRVYFIPFILLMFVGYKVIFQYVDTPNQSLSFWLNSCMLATHKFTIFPDFDCFLAEMKSSSCFWVSDEQTGNRLIYLPQYCQVIVCTLESWLQQLMLVQTIVPSPCFIILGQHLSLTLFC